MSLWTFLWSPGWMGSRTKIFVSSMGRIGDQNPKLQPLKISGKYWDNILINRGKSFIHPKIQTSCLASKKKYSLEPPGLPNDHLRKINNNTVRMLTQYEKMGTYNWRGSKRTFPENALWTNHGGIMMFVHTNFGNPRFLDPIWWTAKVARTL